MRRTLFASLLLAGALGAQSTVVVPAGFANKEGGSDHWIVGRYENCHSQQIYAKSVMPATPITIKSFKMRRDGNRTTAYEAHKYNIEVFMSNRALDPPGGCGMGWAQNRGPDFAQVMNKKAITWPADPQPTTPPAPFTILFPLDKPFPYKGKAFLVEFKSDFATTPPKKYYYYWYTDAESYPSTGWKPYVAGTKVNIGTSCRPPGATSDPANYGFYPYPGSPFWKYSYWRISKAGIPAILFVGSTDKKWGSINLPFDLAPLGAKGCNLYIDMVLAYASKTDAGGRADFKMGVIPVDPGLTGQVYFIQQFAFDPSFNAMGMVSTYGRKYTVGTGFTGTAPAFTFYTYKSSATSRYDTNDPFAVFYSARANIIEFTY